MGKRFPAIAAKYSGEPRLVGPWPRFKKGDVVFVCHMTDLFAMPFDIVIAVLAHCFKNCQATYVFQSKRPMQMDGYTCDLPLNCMCGTTIETDLLPDDVCGDRIYWMRKMREQFTTFITIEPIQKFSMFFADTIISAHPSFVNIGADSKRAGLPEPTGDEVRKLIADLRAAGIEVREKPNLKRIMK
jgi:hypothetical protein